MDARARAQLQTIREQGIHGRVALEYLARSDAFAFAGLPNRVRTLLVTSEMTWDEARDTSLPYGPPACWATPHVGLAIWRALTDRAAVIPHVELYASSVGTKTDGTPWFRATAEVIGYASRPETIGWVHVVEARRFTHFNDLEGFCRRPVRPLYAVRVTGDDLPRGIYLRPTIPKQKRKNEPGLSSS